MVIIVINQDGLRVWAKNFTCHEDNRREAREHDEYAIGTYMEAGNQEELVGHVPV